MLALLGVAIFISLSLPFLLTSVLRDLGSIPNLDAPILAGLETFRAGGGRDRAADGLDSDRVSFSSPLDPGNSAPIVASPDRVPAEKDRAVFSPRSEVNAAADVPIHISLSQNRQQQQHEPPRAPQQQQQPPPRQKLQQPRPVRRWAPRFPQFGTESFERHCSWAANFTRRAERRRAGTDCSFLARPTPTSNEGVANWASEVAIGAVFAQQVGCRLYADYGPGVDVGRVLISVNPSSPGDEYNWTVPEGYRCGMKDRCFGARPYKEKNLRIFTRYLKHKLLPPPEYRFIYNNKIETGQFDELARTALPGFDAEEGMACAIGSVFELAPSAAEFVPHLFTEIIPALRDDTNTFVLALYVRTGNTDKMANMEREGKEVKQKQYTKLSSFDKRITECALQVERERLSPESQAENSDEGEENSYPSKTPSRIVWMVITDSPSVGKIIASEYDEREVVFEGEGGSAANKSIKRRVLTTGARGIQTRKQRNPSTVDFAEAIIDWYLIGESNAVILSSSMTFGATGAMRTARPLYRVGNGCNPISMMVEKNTTAAAADTRKR